MRNADTDLGTTTPPGPDQTGSRSRRHQNRPRRSHRLLKVAGAVVAVIAIAAGVLVYNHDSSGVKPLPRMTTTMMSSSAYVLAFMGPRP